MRKAKDGRGRVKDAREEVVSFLSVGALCLAVLSGVCEALVRVFGLFGIDIVSWTGLS